MTKLFTSQAERLFSYRWWYLSVSIACFASMLVAMMLLPLESTRLLWGALGAICWVSWALLCMCFWFHPIKGALYAGPVVRRLPGVIQTFTRAYASVFLWLFFFFGGFVWPVFAFGLSR